mmetsp:Transcript_6009/g.10680  ORF Transcript_6009/g.10680 Transcript_6009/m.10680 type:complete len:403 (+) Transcript_6009:5476-6684(+)
MQKANSGLRVVIVFCSVVCSLFLSYALIVLVVYCSPKLVSALIFSHWLRIPGVTSASDLSDLRALRIEPYARNIQINSTDGVVLRGWHLLPAGETSFAASKFSASSQSERDYFFDKTIGRIPELELHEPVNVLLFFHGNALDRSFPNRIDHVRFLAHLTQCHVLAMDLRGFGDSSGTPPTEEGVMHDALAIYAWLSSSELSLDSKEPLEHVKELSLRVNFLIYGQSLGSAVSARMAHELCLKGVCPAGLILDAPFVSMKDALSTHPGGSIFRIIPSVAAKMIERVKEKFVTGDIIGEVECPILIVHGTRDPKIPVTQGRELLRIAQSFNRDIRMVELDAEHSDNYLDARYLFHLVEFIRHTVVTRSRSIPNWYGTSSDNSCPTEKMKKDSCSDVARATCEKQ